MRQIHKHPQIEPIDGTFLKEHLADWIEDKRASVSQITIQNYENRIKPFLTWWSQAGTEITPENLKKYRQWLENEYRDPNGRRPAEATIYTYCSTIRAFLRWLNTSARLDIEISQWIQIPEKPAPRGRFLDLAECQSLFDACSGTLKIRDWAMLALLLGSGCRCFEAAEATKDAARLTEEGGTVTLHKVKFDREGRKRKGRVTVVGPTSAKLIRLHLICNGIEDDPRLLQMSNVAIAERVETLAHRAGVKASTHDLRRTFADWWIDHNQDDRAYLLLKMQLGHALPREDTTAIHYIDLQNPAKVAERLRRYYYSPVEQIRLPELP